MTFAIDWDNTSHDTLHPVEGRRLGPPLPGAAEALRRLHAAGHRICIHSCGRASVIADWMQYYNIPYDGIWQGEGKPVADLYIDDRGYCFTTWERTMRDLAGL